MALKKHLLPYVKFTPSERRGIVILLLVLIIITIIRVAIPYFRKVPDIGNITFDRIEIDNSNQKFNQELNTTYYIADEEKEYFIDTSIKINPNIASLAQLQKVGITAFAANNLIKYRNSGGVIYSLDDLIKIYGIDSNLVDRIHNQVILSTPENNSIYKVRISPFIEINSADADTIMLIPCIGPVLSARIVKYRSQLGGFVSLSQLREVYGIDSTCYENLELYLFIDSNRVHWLNLNTADEKLIYMHPYFSRYQAREIIKFRELMGDFVDVNQLKEYHILTESELSRAAKYLMLNNE